MFVHCMLEVGEFDVTFVSFSLFLFFYRFLSPFISFRLLNTFPFDISIHELQLPFHFVTFMKKKLTLLNVNNEHTLSSVVVVVTSVKVK